MSGLRYPNETTAYRTARDRLQLAETALVDQVKAVAALRQRLPLGGQIREDYQFSWATSDQLGTSVRLSELFRDKDTLLMYNLMFGPSWDAPCPSCTSLVDGFDRTAYQIDHDASLVVVAKAPASAINTWVQRRQWSQIKIVSGSECEFQSDYGCQGDTADVQRAAIHVFQKSGDEIHHFWGTEIPDNDLDTVWAYWNLMDLTPAGRPDRDNPPQNFPQ